MGKSISLFALGPSIDPVEVAAGGQLVQQEKRTRKAVLS